VSVSVSAPKLAKKFSFGLVSFLVGRAAASFGFGRNWVNAASISSPELHFITVRAQYAVISAGFMTVIELFERWLFCYTV